MSRYNLADGIVGLQLASAYTSGAGSLVLQAGQGAKFTSFPCRVTVITNATYGMGSSEVLCSYTVTGKSTDTLTGVAAISGFTDRNFAIGDYIEMRVMSEFITELQNPTFVTTASEGGLPNSAALSTALDSVFGATQGDILYRGASAWAVLAPGTSGQFLETGGASANPIWGTPSGGGGSGTVGSGTTNQVAYYASGGTAVQGESLSALIDAAIDNTQGDILYRGASAWAVLAPGTSGQFLETGGAAANPVWGTAAVLGANIFTGLQTLNPASGPAAYVEAGSLETAIYGNGSSGSSMAIAWDKGNNQSVTITGAVTFTFTAPTNPGKFTIICTQDGTGHVYAFPSAVLWPGGVSPTLSSAASAIDVVTFLYDGTNYYGVASTAFAT